MSEHTTTAPADSGQQAAPPPKPKRPKPKSMLMIGEQTNALFENARLAKERGEKVGWSASIFPQEIAETLGLNVLYPENHAAGIAARHQANPFLQECEGPLGYNNDLCAYAKLNLAYAAVLNGESEVELPDGGKMVKPDFLLLTNNICNQLTKWYENLAYQLNIPVFFIDTCYNPWDYVTETRVRYVRTQIDQLIKDLCAFTGKTWDEARFKEVMTISQRNSYLWERANNLLDHKPAPSAALNCSTTCPPWCATGVSHPPPPSWSSSTPRWRRASGRAPPPSRWNRSTGCPGTALPAGPT